MNGRGVAVLAVSVLTLVSCDSTSGSQRFLINGSVGLTGDLSAVEVDEEFVEGQPCRGRRVFADLVAGAQVVVANEDDSIVGKGTLEDGEISLAHRTGLAGTCSFEFQVEVEPSEFYELQVGNRDGPTYSHAELDDQEWTVALNISS